MARLAFTTRNVLRAILHPRPAESHTVARWDQYEIWALREERWELVASFTELQVANAVAQERKSRVRLVHAIYDGARMVEKEILAEIGATRETA